MKIAYILHLFPRLHNTFILNEIIHLIKKGHEVYIFSINKSHEKVINKEALTLKDKTYYFEDFLIKNKNYFKRHFIDVIRKLSNFNPLFYRLTGGILFGDDKNGINIDKYFKYFGWNIYAVKLIADEIKQKKIEIIIGGFGNRPATAAMILSMLTEIPFIFETHAYDLFVDFPFAKKKIETAKKIFTISNYNKKYLIDHFKCPASKIVIKRVSFNKDYCDQIYGKPKKENLILSVCRLVPIKGLENAIDAFKLVIRKRKDLKYMIIGGGPLKDQLLRKVERLSLGDKIFFLGDISNEQALDFIAQSTIVLLPSVIGDNGDRDGIPTSLIEAMYLKTPVISSNVSGIPELVDDGVNGFLTEPGNISQIAEKIEELLLDKALRVRMGEYAREKINEEFEIEDNLKKFIDVLENIINNYEKSKCCIK